ncbi:killer cell lectin-like receptor subfamily I member 1 [Trichechus manatus latirostris]|uniref:Killer cell lectin-like receptor subfamily I member 1 n=1 Tax=Trichechus manatus latirostris TaxID=127582 RepID=A0A2Y9QJI1_TRIMA|nr:killer cell lectin-like receptor subfamily I member 1 [Trichechus manatus latirostris]
MFVFNRKSCLEVLKLGNQQYTFTNSTLQKFYLDSYLSFSYKSLRFILQVETLRRKSSKQLRLPLLSDRQSSAWQVITGSLGVLCVVLMTTVGILLANCGQQKLLKTRYLNRIPKDGIMSIPKYRIQILICFHFLKVSHALCLDHWIGFRNSCYHLFKESKTWSESYAACKELNSRLMKIHIKEELKLLTLFGMEGWIDLKMNKTDGPLVWQDGTQMNQSLLKFPGKKNHTCAYVSGIYIYSDNCSSGESYICEL